MPWDYYADTLPLAIGLQLRNVALTLEGAKIVPPGRTAEARAREILGDQFGQWVEDNS